MPAKACEAADADSEPDEKPDETRDNYPVTKVIAVNSPSPEEDDLDDELSSAKMDAASDCPEGSTVLSGMGDTLQVRSPVARTTSNRSSIPAGGTAAGGGPEKKGKKIGHRRVKEIEGEAQVVTYKKFETGPLMGSIQLGLHQSIGSLAGQEDRDLLMKDFMPIETVSFTRDGTLQKTPAHNYSEFRFRTYAPFAFKKYRQMFDIEERDFLVSVASEPMRELSNPGASGSIFYITRDDKFICKTVQHKDADFLQELLPGYYMNLKQNPRTLLPKFFGLYCYSCNTKNVRVIVMNNLLPSDLKMHHCFDLKGSTYKRKASKSEKAKKSPTFKDLDFLELFPKGISLQPELYDNLMNSIERDCRVLESFKIMDYSLLIGIHNLDQAAKEDDSGNASDGETSSTCKLPGKNNSLQPQLSDNNFERQGSVVFRERTIAHTTALESITMEIEPSEEELIEDGDSTDGPVVNNVWGGIPAKNAKGENLLLFIGIIDILQAYGVLKKAEHYWKSLFHDGDTVSVHRPSFYAQRFQSFMGDKVFKRAPAASTVSGLRPTLSFRRSNYRRTLSKDNENFRMSNPGGGGGSGEPRSPYQHSTSQVCDRSFLCVFFRSLSLSLFPLGKHLRSS